MPLEDSVVDVQTKAFVLINTNTRLLHPDEEAENSETWNTSFYNTAALYGDAQRL